ncbi:hypothetical protein ABZZ79_27820 [Streptomyces sp. NPDC006458]|uniref:hypothetical protein n=1 Tax=Streptomyces sp. NPDC006458 TaxID=3154302 RepID=UPI0033BEB2A0
MSDQPTSQTPDPLRGLLDAARQALTLPSDAPGYDRRLLDRAALVRTVLDAVLGETPEEIAWNTGYLQRKLVLEEQNAAERERQQCRRCHHPFDPADTRFDGRARHQDTPWCRHCIDNCHEGSAEHLCAICEPSRYGGEDK